MFTGRLGTPSSQPGQIELGLGKPYSIGNLVGSITTFMAQLRQWTLTGKVRPYKAVAQRRVFNFTAVITHLSTIDVQPPTFETNTKETVAVNFDTSLLLGSTETISAPTHTLVTLPGRQNVTGAFQGSPTFNGNTIQSILVGGALAPGQQYQLIWTFNTSTGLTKSGTLTVITLF